MDNQHVARPLQKSIDNEFCRRPSSQQLYAEFSVVTLCSAHFTQTAMSKLSIGAVAILAGLILVGALPLTINTPENRKHRYSSIYIQNEI